MKCLRHQQILSPDGKYVAVQWCLGQQHFRGETHPSHFWANLPPFSFVVSLVFPLPSVVHPFSSPSRSVHQVQLVGLGSAVGFPVGSGAEPFPQHICVYFEVRKCVWATIFGSFGGNQNVHRKFLNQNGRQFRVHYARGRVNALGACVGIAQAWGKM